MKKCLIFCLSLLLFNNQFAQRVETISQEKLLELFKEDFDFWTYYSHELMIASGQPVITEITMWQGKVLNMSSNLRGSQVKKNTVHEYELPVFDFANNSEQIRTISQLSRPYQLILHQSASSPGSYGLGWLNDFDSTCFYYTTNITSFNSLLDKRRIFFLKLLTDLQFTNLLDTGIVFKFKNNKSSTYAVIDLLKDANDTTQFDFLKKLTEFAFKKYDSSFSSVYYAKGVKNYSIDMDKNYSLVFKPSDPGFFNEITSYNDQGEAKVYESGYLNRLPFETICVGFDKKQKNSSITKHYAGCKKHIRTASGVDIGPMKIYLTSSDFYSKSDSFSKNLAEYLFNIYE